MPLLQFHKNVFSEAHQIFIPLVKQHKYKCQQTCDKAERRRRGKWQMLVESGNHSGGEHAKNNQHIIEHFNALIGVEVEPLPSVIELQFNQF